jgi:ferric-dicitrate binding protein FerR (iron transport regulator)
MSEQDRDREAREALERIRRDSETLGTSSLARMSHRVQDHFAGKDAVSAGPDGRTDPIELWGRRIGRALSLVGVVVLALWLAVQLRLL